MATIKKKDLKNYKPAAKTQIEELVDDSGNPISGGVEPNTNDEIETAPHGTSDDHASLAIQPNRFFYGFGGTAYSRGHHVQAESEVDKIAEAKMKDMIENLTNKRENSDMVKMYNDTDMNTNDIPDLEELSDERFKASVVKNAQDLVTSLKQNEASGDEMAMVLNFILKNINTREIQQGYKNKLKGLL